MSVAVVDEKKEIYCSLVRRMGTKEEFVKLRHDGEVCMQHCHNQCDCQGNRDGCPHSHGCEENEC